MGWESDIPAAIRESWPRPFSLLLVWLSAILVAVAVATAFPLWCSAVVGLLISFVGTVAWINARRLRRCPPGSVGFVVAISVDSDDVYPSFQRDFVHNLRNLLRQGELKSGVWFYEVPQFRLNGPVDQDKAAYFRQKTEAAFVLYGQVRTRQESETKHYLDLHGLVGHAETTESNKTRLTDEFTELLPRRLIASSKASLPAFEITSSISSVVAKYIAGIAAFVSGLNGPARALYSDAQAAAVRLSSRHAAARKIVERVPLRFGEISLTEASKLHSEWRKSRDDHLLVEMEVYLDECAEAVQQFPAWKTLKAISMVAASKGDLSKIERMLRGLPKEDPITQMNLAFLDVAKGNLRSAVRHYRNAAQSNVSMDVVDEVMCFLDWYRDFRSDAACNVAFAHGFISYCILKDRHLAEEYFQDFVSLSRGKNQEQVALVPRWLEELPVIPSP